MNAAQMVSKDAAPLVAEGGQVAGLPAQRQPGVVAHYGTVFWSWVKVRNPFRHKVARGDARGAVQPELKVGPQTQSRETQNPENTSPEGQSAEGQSKEGPQ